MKSCALGEIVPDAIVAVLSQGEGAARRTGPFAPGVLFGARRSVVKPSDGDGGKAARTRGEAKGAIGPHRRARTLRSMGAIIARTTEHPAPMTGLRMVLGTTFIERSVAANRILPGRPGQEPHIDCPGREAQAPETKGESGATDCVPGTERHPRSPTGIGDPYGSAERMTGAIPIRPRHDRSAAPVRPLPEWLRPMDDMPAARPAGVTGGASPDLAQLSGRHRFRPEAPDAAAAGHAAGRT